MEAGESQCCSHHALKGLTVRGVVVAMQSSNVTCQDIFYSAPVELGETGGSEPIFPYATQEVEMWLSFLDNQGGVD